MKQMIPLNASLMTQAQLPSVVELSAAASTHCVQVLVALDLPALHRLYRTRATFAIPLRTLPVTALRRRGEATVGTDSGARAAVARLPVIWSGAAIESMAAPSHRPRSVVVNRIRIPTAAHCWVEECANVDTVLHPIVRAHTHAHVGQVEASRSASGLHVVAHREVAIAVGVTTRWRNMRWIDNIAVDKSELEYN